MDQHLAFPARAYRSLPSRNQKTTWQIWTNRPHRSKPAGSRSSWHGKINLRNWWKMAKGNPSISSLRLHWYSCTWTQTEFYHNNSAVVNGKITYHLFSETDQIKHARMKRPIVKYYSMSSMLAMEPLMDKVLEDFCAQLNARFVDGTRGRICDLGEWITFCESLPRPIWCSAMLYTNNSRCLMGHERCCIL